MLYDNLTITLDQRQPAGYPVSLEADRLGRTTTFRPPPGPDIQQALRVLTPAEPVEPESLRAAGQRMFQWLFAGDGETFLRVAWDRAEHLGRGLRLRLSATAPELNALPWELLVEPERDHIFSTSISTPLVRYLNLAGAFGSLVASEADLPLRLLLVAPDAPDLDVARERAQIEEALDGLQDLLSLHILDGPVTQQALSDALLESPYDILHFSGHGAFADGESYVALNNPEGGGEIVSGRSFAQLLGNHHSLRLVVLNACSTGQNDTRRAFVGLAPQLLRRGIPAVTAMQYPILDREATLFAREFYQQLCTGENAGQVDVAATHARNMLAVLYPRSTGWAAPVVSTRASDGVIYDLAEVITRQAGADPARAALLISSLQVSMEQHEDWALADPVQLRKWRRTLRRAEQAYRTHLEDPSPDARQAAQYGLALVTARLEALEQRLARTKRAPARRR